MVCAVAMAQVGREIVKRRTQLLVHRYIYYVLSESLIDDLTYDTWERELRSLVQANPAIAESAKYAEDCPTKCVGSSNLWDYPREVQHLGNSLVAFNQKFPFGYIPEPESVEDDESSRTVTFQIPECGTEKQPRFF